MLATKYWLYGWCLLPSFQCDWGCLVKAIFNGGQVPSYQQGVLTCIFSTNGPFPITITRRQKASTEYYETQRRYNYVTPKSYLELIGFYKFLLDQKRTEVQRQIDRLDVGLSTLRKTAADVAELQVDLTHTMVKVQQVMAV